MAESRYVVLARNDAADPDPDALILRDGFSTLAFLFGPFWLFWHRLWLAGAAALIVQLLLIWAERSFELGLAGSVLPFLLSLLIGLEGPGLVIARHRSRGRREAAALVAQDRREAELRYFKRDWLQTQAPAQPAWPTLATASGRPSARALGLFQGR